jgi:hypothetical protein
MHYVGERLMRRATRSLSGCAGIASERVSRLVTKHRARG